MSSKLVYKPMNFLSCNPLYGTLIHPQARQRYRSVSRKHLNLSDYGHHRLKQSWILRAEDLGTTPPLQVQSRIDQVLKSFLGRRDPSGSRP